MGKEGERAYTNEHVNRGYERGFTPVTPCQGKVGMVIYHVDT